MNVHRVAIDHCSYYGIINFENGNKFEGILLNNLPHSGTLFYGNGDVYTGKFANGRPTIGKKIYADDGSSFEFIRTGIGCFTTANKTSISGYFDNYLCLTDGTCTVITHTGMDYNLYTIMDIDPKRFNKHFSITGNIKNGHFYGDAIIYNYLDSKTPYHGFVTTFVWFDINGKILIESQIEPLHDEDLSVYERYHDSSNNNSDNFFRNGEFDDEFSQEIYDYLINLPP
jgi:hypothetical protein